MPTRRPGLLLLQLGTPDSPRVRDVCRYLREFLTDPRVLDIPAPARWLLVHAVIAPFRGPRSAHAYASIWGPEGSPLLVHSRALQAAVAKELGETWLVELGMRYGRPSVAEAAARLAAAAVDEVTLLPLFPQYASSSSGSALERALRELAAAGNVPALRSVTDFHDDPGFIEAQAALARPVLAELRADHVLFSYHGLPERHVRRSDPTGRHCLGAPDCCAAPVPANRFCYRAQCAATTRALARALRLAPDRHSMSFQSRLGRTPWIRPFTDEVLPELARRGVRRLAVLCPSFVADCLETLEEIGMRGRDQWAELGGEAFALVPCVNAAPGFASALAAMAARSPERSASPTATPDR
jgi:ferrochelatase